MENMDYIKKPKVTIIVPVYNSAEFLYRCMDSLVYQSFKEIEIIAVNNGSTDGSLEILRKYEEDFPNKVRVITIEHAERAGKGRNVGIQAARADYIAFADSDDALHLRAIEWLYDYTQKGKYDLVYAPYIQIRNGQAQEKRKKAYTSDVITIEQALLDAEPAPWAKLFKKNLLEEAGEYPSEFSFEDLAYFFVYVTKAKRIGYFPLPLYYYYWRTDSEVHTIANPRIAETIQAELYGLKNCEQKYREIVSYIIALRIINNIAVRWIFADKFLEHLVNLWPEFSTNPRIYNNKRVHDNLTKHFLWGVNPMPKNVYLDGFGENPFIDEQVVMAEESAFYDGCNVFVLNEHTCNIDELPILRENYDKGNYEYVAGYFALQQIYKNGGVYLGRDMIVDLPMNYTRHLKSFFGYVDQFTYSDQFFGGKAGEPVFQNILNQYQLASDKINYDRTSLSLYIGICLFIDHSIPANARTNIHGLEISIFSPEVISLPFFPEISDDKDLHFCHYSPKNNASGVYVCADTLRWLLDEEKKLKTALEPVNAKNLESEIKKLTAELEKEKRMNSELAKSKNSSAELAKIRTLEAELDKAKKTIATFEKNKSTAISDKTKKLESELQQIKSSRSWKMVQWFRERKNKGIWKVVYKFYLFVYSKTAGKGKK